MMRRELRWALGITLVLTTAALVTSRDNDSPAGVRTQGDWQDQNAGPHRVAATLATSTPASSSLPAAIESQGFMAAGRDVFDVVRLPLPPAPVVAAPVVAATPAAPPAPPPPPVTAKFMGQILSPEGERLVYLRDGAAGVPVEPVGEQKSAEADRNRQWREVGVGAQILRDLGITSIVNLTSSVHDYKGLSGFGIEIVANEKLEG